MGDSLFKEFHRKTHRELRRTLENFVEFHNIFGKPIVTVSKTVQREVSGKSPNLGTRRVFIKRATSTDLRSINVQADNISTLPGILLFHHLITFITASKRDLLQAALSSVSNTRKLQRRSLWQATHHLNF